MKRQIVIALIDECYGLWCAWAAIMMFIHVCYGVPGPLLRTEGTTWGLYSWCSVKDGNITGCHTIHPGESPAYFEVARFSALFSVAVVIFNCLIILWLPQKSTCQRLFIRVIIWLPSLSLGTTVGLVGTYYKDDDRWKDSNPHLTTPFKVLAGLAAVQFLWACYYFLVFASSFITVIRDKQLGRQRQDRQSRPPPNAEPISNQGEKNQTLCCQRLHSAKIKASTLWKQLCRKLVTAMKCLKASICGKRLSRKPHRSEQSFHQYMHLKNVPTSTPI